MIRSLRSLIAPAFAVLVLGLATGAQADYTYSIVPGSFTAPAGVTVTPLTGSVLDSQVSNPTVIGLTYTTANFPNGTPFNFQLLITGTGAGNPGTQTFQVNGTLIVQAFPGGIFGATYNASSVTSLSGSGYSVPAALVNYLQNGNAAGNIGVTIIPSAVPEPTSIVMLGLGLVGTVGFAARRRFA